MHKLFIKLLKDLLPLGQFSLPGHNNFFYISFQSARFIYQRLTTAWSNFFNHLLQCIILKSIPIISETSNRYNSNFFHGKFSSYPLPPVNNFHISGVYLFKNSAITNNKPIIIQGTMIYSMILKTPPAIPTFSKMRSITL